MIILTLKSSENQNHTNSMLLKYGMNIGLTLGSVQNAKFVLNKTIKHHYFDKKQNFIFFIQD